jgi:hypothetical protein
MTPTQNQPAVTDDAVLKEVRWRYRICNYLFTLGAMWWAAGYGGGLFARKPGADIGLIWMMIALVGFGIFSAAFAMTLAIYRCPVCDKYLSRFRPDKTRCAGCGARVRLTTTGRP